MGEQRDIDARGDVVFSAADEERHRNRVIIRLLVAAMLFGVVSTFVHFYASNSLQTDIREVVRSQIPALQQQVATRNQGTDIPVTPRP